MATNAKKIDMAVVVLCLSAKTGNNTATVIIGSLLFCFPPLLHISGLQNAKWLSAYPLFHMSAMMAENQTALFGWFILLFWVLGTYLGMQYLGKLWKKQA